MIAFFKAGGHYLTGLAVIGALSGLIATGTVSADVGVPIIAATGTALIGGQLGATNPTKTS